MTATRPEGLHENPVLVVDFGAQYAQLIARRVREANVFSEVVPHTMSTQDILAKKPGAIILSGGPSSVYADDAPGLDPALLDAGVPVFGMCYGFQAMVQALGGTVERTGLGEYGSTQADIRDTEASVEAQLKRRRSTAARDAAGEVEGLPLGFALTADAAPVDQLELGAQLERDRLDDGLEHPCQPLVRDHLLVIDHAARGRFGGHKVAA